MSQIEESGYEESGLEVTPEMLLDKISDAIDVLQTSQDFAVSQMEQINANVSEINKIASTTQLGRVKVDGVTVFADEQGVLSADIVPGSSEESGDESEVNMGSSRNVGEVFYSLIPLVDAGIHLLDGDIILGDGVYKAFVDYMADLSEDSNYSNLFCTEAQWQTSVSTYGVCGKFVYDTVTGNLRLPRVTGLIEGTVNQNAIGDLTVAGLPNITGSIDTTWEGYNTVTSVNNITEEGAFESEASTNTSYGYLNAGTSAQYLFPRDLSFDASRSSSIYGNSNTVQPQTVKGYVYIVLANSRANPVSVEIDNVVTEVNNLKTASVPVGTIIMSANATVPSGYLLCNGSTVGRATYPELFAAIGTTYGEGDGSTTFALPNLIGKFLEGSSTAGVEHEAGLPNISGNIGRLAQGTNSMQITGPIYSKSGANAGSSGLQSGSAVTGWTDIAFDASLSNSIYGNSDTVQPPSVTALPCIKAFSSVIDSGTVNIANFATDVNSKTNAVQAAHAAMPSGQYIDITIPTTTGTQIEFPSADGYIFAQGTATSASNAFLTLNNHTSTLSHICLAVAQNNTVYSLIPVSKNDSVFIGYNLVTVTNLRFIYTNGTAPSN